MLFLSNLLNFWSNLCLNALNSVKGFTFWFCWMFVFVRVVFLLRINLHLAWAQPQQLALGLAPTLQPTRLHLALNWEPHLDQRLLAQDRLLAPPCSTPRPLLNQHQDSSGPRSNQLRLFHSVKLQQPIPLWVSTWDLHWRDFSPIYWKEKTVFQPDLHCLSGTKSASAIIILAKICKICTRILYLP